jgi:hypothetical protein
VDSAVFIEALSLTDEPHDKPVPSTTPWGMVVMLGLFVLVAWQAGRRARLA